MRCLDHAGNELSSAIGKEFRVSAVTMERPPESGRVWMDAGRAAEYACTTVGTLAALRSKDKGPAFRKVGRKVLYDRADLDAWIEGAAA